MNNHVGCTPGEHVACTVPALQTYRFGGTGAKLDPGPCAICDAPDGDPCSANCTVPGIYNAPREASSVCGRGLGLFRPIPPIERTGDREQLIVPISPVPQRAKADRRKKG